VRSNFTVSPKVRYTPYAYTSVEDYCQEGSNPTFGDTHTAFVVEDKKSDFPNLPEFEIEKRVMEFADIIIIIDSIDTAENRRCPGLSSECTYIMMNKHLQDKTIYFAPKTLTESDITRVNGLHYLYFPTIYLVDYINTQTLLVSVTSFAKKEAHRLAHMISNHVDNATLKDLYGVGNKHSRRGA